MKGRAVERRATQAFVPLIVLPRRQGHSWHSHSAEQHFILVYAKAGLRAAPALPSPMTDWGENGYQGTGKKGKRESR